MFCTVVVGCWEIVLHFVSDMRLCGPELYGNSEECALCCSLLFFVAVMHVLE